MELVTMMGAAPGHMVAMVRHDDELVRVRLEVARHPLGGWQARRTDNAWSLRCNTLETAILLEAGETLEEEEGQGAALDPPRVSRPLDPVSKV